MTSRPLPQISRLHPGGAIRVCVDLASCRLRRSQAWFHTMISSRLSASFGLVGLVLWGYHHRGQHQNGPKSAKNSWTMSQVAVVFQLMLRHFRGDAPGVETSHMMAAASTPQGTFWCFQILGPQQQKMICVSWAILVEQLVTCSLANVFHKLCEMFSHRPLQRTFGRLFLANQVLQQEQSNISW